MRYLLIGAIMAVLTACDASPPPPPPKTVFDPLLEQRDKVQEMADKLPQERKENLDRAIAADTQ